MPDYCFPQGLVDTQGGAEVPGNDRRVLGQRLHDRRESSSGYAVRVFALLDIMGASAALTTP